MTQFAGTALGGVRELLTFAVGAAAGPALRPAIQDILNAEWQAHPVLPLVAAQLAEIVAEDVQARDWAAAQAGDQGINGERFDALVAATRTAPQVAQLLDLWRRGLIDETAFEHGLRKLRLEPRWDAAVKALRQRLLSPAELANARQQGFITTDRQMAEAALQGIDPERAEIQFELAGLPPGIGEALDLLRRGVIDDARFAQIVREGHTKTKYTDNLLALRRVLLSAAQNVNAAIRGWITVDEAHARNAQLGLTHDDSQLLYDSAGRPPGPGQLQTAFNRGLIDQARFDHGIRESDVRPEWLDVEFALRHRYPSLFQLRRAVQDGGLSIDRAKTIMKYEGYEEQDITTLAASFGSGTTTGAKGETKTDILTEYEGLFVTRAEATAALTDLGYTATQIDHELSLQDARRVRRFRDQAVNMIAKSYIDHHIDAGTAQGELGALGISAEAQTHLLSIWDLERSIARRELTPAQVKRAYKRNLLTLAEATTELEDRGYDATDASLYLQE